MLLRHLPLLTSLAWLVLQDSGAATEDSDDQDDPNATEDREGAGDDTSAVLGDKGKKAIAAEREARRKAEDAAKALKDRLDKLEADANTRAEAEAKEQGKWRELAEKRDAELADLRKQLAERDRDALRASIARKHKLPEDAVKYLTGDDEASIEDSAKDLARLTARSEDVDTDSGKPNANHAANQSKSVLANYEFGKRRR